MVDDDLEQMSREQLAAEVRRPRRAMPETSEAQVAVPPWPQLMRGCVAYPSSLDIELPNPPVHRVEFE